MRKRILAILMAFALFVVMGPVEMFAFATDDEEAAEGTKVEMQSEEEDAENGEAGDAVVEGETTPVEEAVEEAAPAEGEAVEEAAPAEGEAVEEAAPAEGEAAEEAAPAEDEAVLEQAKVSSLTITVGAVTASSVQMSWAETLEAGETLTIKYAGGELAGVTGNSCTVSGLAAATDYTFEFFSGSNKVGQAKATTAPGQVPAFRKVSSYKTVVLKWNAVPGASKYEIRVNGALYGSTNKTTLTHKVGSEKDIINLLNKGKGAKYSGNLDGKDRFTYTISAKDANGKVLAESTTTGDIVKTLYYKLTFKGGATLTSHSGGKKKINIKKGAVVYARGFTNGKYIFDYQCKDGKVRTFHTMKIRVKAKLSPHITAIKNKRGENTQPPYTVEEAEQYANDRGIKKATSKYMIWVNLFSQKEYIFKKVSGKWRIVTANGYGLKNKVMAALPVSTGKASMPTATGSTKINRKLKSQHGTPLWNVTKYFSVHGVQKRWPKVGWPESGACARNQMPNAKWIYNKIPKYTRVFVH